MAKKLSKKERKRLKYLESLKKEVKKEVKEGRPRIKITKTLLVVMLLFLTLISYFVYSSINRPVYTPKRMDRPIVGSPDAPITIKSFSEFQCPYCADFYTKTYPELKSKYVDAGKVKFVFYEFPIEELHPLSMRASEAARCAYEQDKYEDYAMLLYSRQSQWTKAGPGKFKDYARELGLNMDEFSRCFDSGAMREIIKKEIEEGKQLQISGTPTFFINDRRIVGARPFEDFDKVISSFLNSNSTS
jgi:protein-disulfide isomerase